MPDWRLIALRIFEAISLAVLAAFVWYCVVRPLRTTGKIGLDGKFVIGGLVCFVVDGFLNVQEYLFAWNSANVNRGSGCGSFRSTTRTRRRATRSR